MKILYLHQYFRKPEEGGGLRSYHLSTALVRAGHEVDLITAYNGPVYKTEIVEGVKVHYLPVPYDNSFGTVERILAFLKYILKSTRLAFSVQNIDTCFATSTPLTIGVPALLLKKLRNVPYIFEVRDLWPEAPVQLGYIRNSVLKRVLYWLEKVFYRNAVRIVALSPGMVAGVKKYQLNVPVHLIPNMADCAFFQPVYSERSAPDAPFRISYLGTFGKANRVEFLLAAAKACQEARLAQVQFCLAGDGAELGKIKQQASDWGLANIKFLGKLSREGVRDLLNQSDATYISFDTFTVLQTNSPNKFFDSLAAGKLCIVNTKGWLQDLVEKHQCGFYADPYQPETFVKELLPYLNNTRLLRQYQENARQLAVTHFSKEKLLHQLVQLF